MKLSVLVWIAALLVGNAAAQADGPPVAPSLPAIGGAGESQMVYPLQLPAGISLISSPLDAGSGRAIDAFIGIDGEWPFLFEWDSSTQRFLDPDDSMMSLGAGYWYYSPAPSTLLVFGKPYPLLTQLTKDILPGWHLFGVPFATGVDWSGLSLYASGNPVGLEHARALGWIGSDILTMQGSRWQTHAKGAPFKPGAAYWIRTTVPLSVRAAPAPGAAPGDSLEDIILKNIGKVIEEKDALIKTGADIKAGKLTTGGFSGGGAVFGLANALVQKYRYNNIMDELNTMDDKVDELLTGMSAIQNQLADIESEIDGLTQWLVSDAKLGQPLRDAEGWIAQFYSDPTQPGQSYNWARWKLAGCDVSVSTCTATVTDASSQAFEVQYVNAPANNPPEKATDNFYLWWSYSVLGGSRIPIYTNGRTAGNLVQSLHDGMVFDAGTSENGLRAYMEFIFSKSTCATDVTACDLYSQVYLPFEAYFQQLITNQITLVQAIVEADSVLASSDQTTHAYDSFASDYLTGFQQKLSEEAEAFVQVAEQIALYRAADGRFDWSSFNTSDAAQVLSRADFLAARLVSSSTGKPWPWPPGVTGRIFYTERQSLPSATSHTACIGSTCTTLTEETPGTTHTGSWPYLQWTVANGVAQGTPTNIWKVRRLTSQQMSAGTYSVASATNAQYATAKLVVSQYGDDYSNPPATGTTAVLYGSFNDVEGSLGIGALGSNRTYAGGGDNDLRNFTVTPSTFYTQMNVVYKNAEKYGTSNWYEYIKIKVPDNSVFGAYARVRVFWPNQVAIALGDYSIVSSSGCTSHYYYKLGQSLKMVQANGNVKSGTDKVWYSCGTSSHGFGSCNFSSQDRNGSTMLASAAVTLDHSEIYTLQAHFTDEIWGYYYDANGYLCRQGPTSGSNVTWNVFNPTIVLVK